MAGARLLCSAGCGPLLDHMGLFHAVLSYHGGISVTVTACRDMLPDPDFYTECIPASFDELKQAAGGAGRSRARALQGRRPRAQGGRVIGSRQSRRAPDQPSSSPDSRPARKSREKRRLSATRGGRTATASLIGVVAGMSAGLGARALRWFFWPPAGSGTPAPAAASTRIHWRAPARRPAGIPGRYIPTTHSRACRSPEDHRQRAYVFTALAAACRCACRRSRLSPRGQTRCRTRHPAPAPHAT